MIHTIEMINKSPLLPNVTLGYEIYDTCADPTTAIKTVMRLMDDKSDSAENCIPLKCSYTNYNSTVKAVIGESHSEISIVIAHLLSVPLIPQVMLYVAYRFFMKHPAAGKLVICRLGIRTHIPLDTSSVCIYINGLEQ